MFEWEENYPNEILSCFKFFRVRKRLKIPKVPKALCMSKLSVEEQCMAYYSEVCQEFRNSTIPIPVVHDFNSDPEFPKYFDSDSDSSGS